MLQVLGMGSESFSMSFPFKLPKGKGFQNRNQHPISPQSTCEQRAGQPKPRNNLKAKSTVRTIHDRYHNSDPIARLIAKRNESKVMVDGIDYPGLLDSGAQMSTITTSQARKWDSKLKVKTNY